MLPTSFILALTLTAAPPAFNQLRADGTRAVSVHGVRQLRAA